MNQKSQEEALRTNIRNICIIAHIDHGKSTLADRLLEQTGTIAAREMQAQVLDAMDLEREKGITIKAHPVTLFYKDEAGQPWQINLIDTPGHVDFSYEVSRAMAACDGAFLLVAADQGVQAQSLANVYLAIENSLVVVPVINKADSPNADLEGTATQIAEVLGLDIRKLIICSAKTGMGVDEVLKAIIKEIPPPKEPEDNKLRALVFDSQYDPYKGVVVYVRIFSGSLRKGQTILFVASQKTFGVLEVGIFSPQANPQENLQPGQVGYLLGNIKNPQDVQVGDTITLIDQGDDIEALPGFKTIKPVVYAGIYPVDADEFDSLRDALHKLQLNDAALHIETESSVALGFGFRCGFLGVLHLEITVERLQREFDLTIVTSSPSVTYKFILTDGREVELDNAAHYPEPTQIARIEEPWVKSHIIIPKDVLGGVMALSMDKRGDLIGTETFDDQRIMLTYKFPLNEILTDFNDRLKSLTRGYGSFDYEFDHYAKGDIVRLDIYVNEELADPFSCLIHRDKAAARGRAICSKLMEVIPRQQFKVPFQAAIGGKIIARETLSATKKNVTAKCYGGDITRKMKLLQKQVEGKKRMKAIGKVSIPQKAFLEVLKTS